MASGVTIAILLLYLQNSYSHLDSTECELTTGRTLTVIKSVRFPDPYGPNVDCRYAIQRRSESICSVTFLFNVLDVVPSPDCSGDYLQFEDTEEKLCGSKPVGFSRTLSFKDENNSTVSQKRKKKKKTEIVMNFHSGNNTRGGLGYMVTVVQQECPRPSCDTVHKQSEFTLASPNYPLPYDNQRICKYVIQRASPAICRLSLTMRHFDVEEDAHCESDFLQLSDGRRLCGVLDPGQKVDLDFNNDTLVLEFRSDHLTTTDGFQLDVQQVECNTEAAQQQIPSGDGATTPFSSSSSITGTTASSNYTTDNSSTTAH